MMERPNVIIPVGPRLLLILAAIALLADRADKAALPVAADCVEVAA